MCLNGKSCSSNFLREIRGYFFSSIWVDVVKKSVLNFGFVRGKGRFRRIDQNTKMQVILKVTPHIQSSTKVSLSRGSLKFGELHRSIKNIDVAKDSSPKGHFYKATTPAIIILT